MSLHRINKLLKDCVSTFVLDLNELVILTEAATGAYLYTPVMAALAGAKMVYAITSDSLFGTKEEVKAETLQVAKYWGVEDKIRVIFNKEKEIVSECDIITNSGFVRPINRDMISWMKPTAVIPLMWEPWEFREGEIDLAACREHGIIVMGTDESKQPLDMYSYAGFIGMKMLFELGIEGCKASVILLGGKESLGGSIYKHFMGVGIEVAWFTADGENESQLYSQFMDFFIQNGAKYDALIVAEHANDLCLLGDHGLVSYEQIKKINPALQIGIIAGNLDRIGLEKSGLHYFPQNILPFGYMSYQSFHLGPLPVLELYAAGLKVGQSMARGRLMEMNIEESKKYAIEHSPAIDF